MKTRKHAIQVLQPLPGCGYYDAPSCQHHVETIHRVLRAEQIGNFSPVFCRYAGNKRVLVQSISGDLSDPFRRDDSYLARLFISLPAMTIAEERALKSAGLHPAQR